MNRSTKMERMLAKDNIIFPVGLFLIGISVILFILLGEDSIWVYHDQLDGELLTYMYQAKYLFSGNDIPEFMNGMGKTALTAPAPLFVLLFKVFSPYAALVLMKYIMMFTGYIGVYLFLRNEFVDPVPAMIAGVLFAYLPLLPVYGLSMMGIPLLIWAYFKLWKCTDWKAASVPLLSVVFVGLGSSLALSGFGMIFMVFIIFCIRMAPFFYEHPKLRMLCLKQKRFGILGMLLFILSFVLTNLPLIGQVLGRGGWISHREEMVISSTPFFSGVFTILFTGTDHTKAFQGGILILAVCVLICGYRNNNKMCQQYITTLLSLNLLIAVICGGYGTAPVVALREQLGGIAYWFQLDRLQWLCPGIWYCILGGCVCYSWKLYDSKLPVRLFFKVASSIVVVVIAFSSFIGGNWKGNLQKVVNAEYAAISWQDFYGEDVFTQVKEYIGRPLEEYRVVSLGIYPAAALYNGFYCLDGYSNNYSLEYKHKFRRIIAGELEKSPYLEEYFDQWGNRCFLFSSQIPGYFTVEKGGFYFEKLSIDTEALGNMGGEYILSAAFIQNAEELGLNLLRAEPFSTLESYYQIYLYQVEG